MFERRPSINSQHNMNNSTTNLNVTPTKPHRRSTDNDYSPTISRYGRSHKPKMQDDYVSTDKKVSAYLKLSPGNQMHYFNMNKEPKKKLSPKKLSPEVPVRRGRPPKPTTPPKVESESIGAESLIHSIKLEPQDPNFPVNGCEWMVGDLAWGRVGGHPFWPCIIALDPIQKIFTKIVQRGRTIMGQRWVHVQFFGDNGRRSWLNSSAIMAFSGRDAFLQLSETVLAGMRRKDPKQTSAFVIKPAVVQVWEKAVQEAEDLANATREERMEFFAIHFPPVIPKQLTREELIEKVLDDSDITPPKKRGRKRKAETIPEGDMKKNKQIKLEHLEIKSEKFEETQEVETVVKEEISIKQEPKEESHSLLSSTPRTIADRKKRQALLMQMARSNRMAAADAAAGDVSPDSTPATPTPVERSALNKRTSFAESTPIEKKKPKKKYTKKTVDVDFQNFHSRNFDKVSDEHPELNEKEINKHLQALWNHMDDTSKSRYRARKGMTQDQEDSESLEETSEELEEENEAEQSSKSSNEAELQSSISSASPSSAGAVQKAPSIKRSCKNLFSGVKSEKVCQICERAGDTVRCRGPCQGFYHPECVTNPPPLVAPTPPATTAPARKGKRGRPKKSLANSPIVENRTPSVVEKRVEQAKEVVTPDKKLEEEMESEPAVEVVEAEGKTLAKVRKSSKDSNSGEEEEGFRCKDCSRGRTQPCFACHEYVQKKTGEAKLYRCVTAACGKVYHEDCLKAWPQTSWRGNNRAVLSCPQHTCHTCVSDNPGVIKARYSNDKLVRCVRCPTSYHYGNYCLPAGSEILTNSQIICPQHYKPARKGITYHINAAWCFICASGGSLICCDLCPTAFHADCLNISTPPDTYVCEDCQTGRFPLYGEIVWVKLGCYRWWPAEILYPAMIPDNILNLPHVRGEFAVRFFGSHDHYWVNRGRVFLYQDGDTAGKSNYKKSAVDQTFERAVKEASEAQRKYLVEKASREAETRPGMKPPNYVKLKANKPVGNVRAIEMNLSNLTPCECDPKIDNPCAPDSDCLNRILMVECHPQVCPAGEKCCNQLFEKRQYPPLQPYQTVERGWGLKTLVPLKKGDFVIEYVGEMIDEEEYKRRLVDMHERNEDNFYFLTIDKDRMLDAGPKGNVARFMNHSCQPNCETQKWTVNGDTRVGLFALCDIPADTELVFNYNLESTGNDKKACMCGAPNCSGFIGVKAIKQEKEENKEKKPVKKKKATKIREGKCFICWKEGDLLRCDGKLCTKVYHLSCLGKKQAPQGYWLCPWHQCNICNKGRVRRCTLCVNSFCQEHSEGNIREDPDSKHLICTKHDQDQAVSNGVVKEVKDTSVLMEVDGNSSTNSTASSLASNPSTKEATNNNELTATDSPRLRTRRSRSFAGDIVVNGSVKKVTGRRKRPSSVDEDLITSHKNTEPKNKKSYKPKERFSTTNSIAKEIINEVIDHLPEESKSILGTCEKNEETNKEITNETSLNKDVDNIKEMSLEQVDDDTAQRNLEQTKNESTNVICNDVENTNKNMDSTIELSEKDPVNEMCDEAENANENTIDTVKVSEKESANMMSNDAENTNEKIVETVELHEKNTANICNEAENVNENIVETVKLPKKDTVNMSNDAENSKNELETVKLNEKEPANIICNEVVNPNKDVLEPDELSKKDPVTYSNPDDSVETEKPDLPEHSAIDPQDDNVNTVQDIEPKTTFGNHVTNESEVSLEMEMVDESPTENDCAKSKSEFHLDVNGDTSVSTNTNHEKSCTAVSECNSKENCVQNGLVVDEKHEDSNKCPDEFFNKESSEHKKNQSSTNLEKTIDADENIEDFELSYSENSTDKLFKSVNSESSVEMKLTDCGTTEEEAAISRKLEELNGPKELVNGIEKSSAMEVA